MSQQNNDYKYNEYKYNEYKITPFHLFSDKTKMVSYIISISIILIIIFSFTSEFIGTTKKFLLKIISVILLSYALYMNYSETNNLMKNIPDLFSNQNMITIRNNAICSYILCLMLFLLIGYISITIFFKHNF